MTLQELINWCAKNGVGMETPIAIRDKDDRLLVKEHVKIDNHPYFGNCNHGDTYLKKVAPKDENGDVDYENLPDFLILSTGY